MALTKVSYSMIQAAPINVADYGATGDGSTDDTVAIQAAFDAVSATGGTIVFVPEQHNDKTCQSTANMSKVSNIIICST